MPTIAEGLASFVVGLRYEALPLPVVQKAKQCILDQLGVQVRGATLPHVAPVLRFVNAMEAKPESTIVYHGGRTVVPYAAYCNAVFGHSCEFDDGLLGAGHPGVCTVPVAMALGEKVGATGKDLITAIVAGYEVICQVGLPIHREMLERGWHPLKVQGVFGAAATAAKLLGLSELETANALAIAGSDASGTMEYDQSGGEVKRAHAGMLVRAGTQAALLAREGLTGPLTIFEGKRGIFRLFGNGGTIEMANLGREFNILNTIFKLYPAVGTIHAPLDAVRMIMAGHRFSHDEIDQINVWIAEWAVLHGGAIYHPHDVLSAQFSLPYSVALRLVKGSNDLSFYLDPQMWQDKAVLTVADKVKTMGMPIPRGDGELAARVEIKLLDGRSLEAHQEFFRGHPRNPPGQKDLEAKFSELAGAVLPGIQVEGVKHAVEGLESMANLDRLRTLLVLSGD